MILRVLSTVMCDATPSDNNSTREDLEILMAIQQLGFEVVDVSPNYTQWVRRGVWPHRHI